MNHSAAFGVAFLTALGFTTTTTAQPTPPLPNRPTRRTVGCATGECHPKVRSATYTHGPVEVDACEVCHEYTDPARHLFNPAPPKGGQCAFCHLGVQRVGGLHSHEPVREGKCIRCHDPHGEEHPQLLRGGDARALCLSCHEKVLEGWITGRHAPLPKRADCSECHVSHSSPLPKQLRAQENGRCGTCHPDVLRLEASDAKPPPDPALAANSAPTKAITPIHAPAAKGCDACHEPVHGTPATKDLKASSQELCASCHGKTLEAAKAKARSHSALETEQGCLNCHDPHKSALGNLLKAPVAKVCLECHAKEIVVDGGSVAAIPSSMTNPAHPHRNCAGCHEPHASDQAKLLHAPAPELCTGCHEDVAKKALTATVPHKAMSALQGCLNCHDPHTGPGKLLRARAAKVCLGCHGEGAERAWATRSAPSVRLDLSTVHKPVREGKCHECHDPHGAEVRSLLIKPLTRAFYQPFELDEYALCLSCHDKRLVLDEKTSDATAFRNGTRNLHFVHVNMERGRSCNVCHEPHASRHARLVRDQVRFGSQRWMLPIAFEANPDGGSCGGGCHQPLAYQRSQPLPLPPPVAPRKQTPVAPRKQTPVAPRKQTRRRGR